MSEEIQYIKDKIIDHQDSKAFADSIGMAIEIVLSDFPTLKEKREALKLLIDSAFEAGAIDEYRNNNYKG